MVKITVWLVLSFACWILWSSTSFACHEADHCPTNALKTDCCKKWTMQNGDGFNSRFSQLALIKPDNVRGLQVVSTFALGSGSNAGGVLAVGNMIFVQGSFPLAIYALDASKHYEVAWKYEPKQDPNAVPLILSTAGQPTIAFGDGLVFVYQADASVVALDAKSGKEIWKVSDGDPAKGEFGNAAPIFVEGKVLVGRDSGLGSRGSLTAYDAKTGKLSWRAFSAGPDSDTLMDPSKTMLLGSAVSQNSGQVSWAADGWKSAGGSAGGSYAVDPDLHLVYYGTGVPASAPGSQQVGDKKWTSAIIARDLDTGFAKWVFQMTPDAVANFPGSGQMILADFKINGGTRKALIHFDANGFAYVLDREAGALIKADKFLPAANWAQALDQKTGQPIQATQGSISSNSSAKDLGCAGTVGAQVAPVAFSPDTSLFYTSVASTCVGGTPYQLNGTPAPALIDAEKAPPLLLAWSLNADAPKWSAAATQSPTSGALATKAGLVFHAEGEQLAALNAKTGEALWHSGTGLGVIGSIATFEQAGRQYIAVVAGGSAPASPQDQAVGAYKNLASTTALGPRLVVFGLPQ